MLYEITHSLLSAWLRSMKDNPFEEGDDPEKETSLQEFMHVLRRERTPVTPAMHSGIDFEDLVTAILEGAPEAPYHVNHTDGRTTLKMYAVAEHPWHDAAAKVANMLHGSKLQYVAQKKVKIGGMDILLNGRLDAMKEGRIFDIKYSGSYERGNFRDSTQHPMYYALVPEMINFTYIISNGTDVWTEMYWWDEIQRIEPVIVDFFQWLEQMNLMETYRKYWQVRT